MQGWDYRLGINGVKRMQAAYNSALVAQGAFSAYSTDDLRAVGGWPDAIGEDIFWVPGVILLLFGYPLIVGWWSIQLLPITLAIFGLLRRWQERHVFRRLHIHPQRDARGFIGYLCIYQVLTAAAPFAATAGTSPERHAAGGNHPSRPDRRRLPTTTTLSVRLELQRESVRARPGSFESGKS